MQPQTTSPFFINPPLFSQISSYLTIPELLRLSTLSHEMKNIVEFYCGNRMKELGMRPAERKGVLHLMGFYWNRCLRVLRIDKDREKEKEKEREVRVATLHQPFKFETILSFEVGTTFTCYLTRDQKARIFRTSALLKFYQDSTQRIKQKNYVQRPDFQIRAGIKQIKSKSQQCLLVKTNGQVLTLATNKNQDLMITAEQILPWTSRIPIAKVTNSYAYTIFHPENATDLPTIFSEVFGKNYQQEKDKEKNGEKEGNFLYLPAKNMINGKQLVVEVPCLQIIEATVGARHAYFISTQNQLFQADLEQKVNQVYPIIKAKPFLPLQGKPIVTISNGYNYFIALQRNLSQLEEWDTQRVIEWLREIGFEAYVKIARVEKLDGKKLKEIGKGVQKKYMHNVLGITTQNMQQKFVMSIEELQTKKSNKDQLWGWGKNQSGQLGSSSANFVARPMKIKSPRFREDQYIDSIFCGWFQTFIRTQKGRIFCTKINSQKRKVSQYQKQQQKTEQTKPPKQSQPQYPEKKVHDSDQQQQQQYEAQIEQLGKQGHRKKSSNRSHNPKKKKKTQVHIKQRQKQKQTNKFQEQQNWSQFQLGKAFFIQAYKQTLFIIQCPLQKSNHDTNNNNNLNRPTKMRTAKAILDKILWSSLKKQQFKIGYIDKDMGLIEMTALEMQMFDVGIKEGRIKYFKKNGIVVWDREEKIDNF